MKKIVWLGLILILLANLRLSHAAQLNNPLYIDIDGIMWAWDGSTLTQTNCNYGVLSPDKTQVVYREIPLFFSEGLERAGGAAGVDFAADLWVCNLASGQLARIAEQPPDAAFYSEAGAPDRWIARSSPVWSADGTEIAWTQIDYPPNEEQTVTLLVYSLPTGETRTLASDIPNSGIPSSLPVHWNHHGILVQTREFNEATNENTSNFWLFDGNALISIIPLTNADDVLLDQLMVTIDGQDFVALSYVDMGWLLLNPTTQETTPMNGFLMRYNGNSAVTLPARLIGSEAHWWVATNGELDPNAVKFYAPSPTDAAVSPTGDVAFVADSVYLWQNGAFTRIEGTVGAEAIQWGGETWGLWTGTAPEPDGPSCPNSLPTRLNLFGQAQIIAPDPFDLQLTPATSGESLGQVAQGVRLEVLHGPVCSNGLTWWYVIAGTASGWLQEGAGDTYWIEPF